MDETPQDFVAISVKVESPMVFLELEDGSTHSFPVLYYPRLAGAQPADLKSVRLRVGGRALRWDNLDEDIWVADAICQRYPRKGLSAVAESSSHP